MSSSPIQRKFPWLSPLRGESAVQKKVSPLSPPSHPGSHLPPPTHSNKVYNASQLVGKRKASAIVVLQDHISVETEF